MIAIADIAIVRCRPFFNLPLGPSLLEFIFLFRDEKADHRSLPLGAIDVFGRWFGDMLDELFGSCDLRCIRQYAVYNLAKEISRA